MSLCAALNFPTGLQFILKKRIKKGKELSCGNQKQIDIQTKSIAAQYLNNNVSGIRLELYT